MVPPLKGSWFKTNSGSLRQAREQSVLKPSAGDAFQVDSGNDLVSVGRAAPKRDSDPGVVGESVHVQAPIRSAESQATGDGSGRRDGRADEMCTSSLALAALEVAVGGGCGTLSWRKLIGIHPQAHRAPSRPPFRS